MANILIASPMPTLLWGSGAHVANPTRRRGQVQAAQLRRSWARGVRVDDQNQTCLPDSPAVATVRRPPPTVFLLEAFGRSPRCTGFALGKSHRDRAPRDSVRTAEYYRQVCAGEGARAVYEYTL